MSVRSSSNRADDPLVYIVGSTKSGRSQLLSAIANRANVQEVPFPKDGFQKWIMNLRDPTRSSDQVAQVEFREMAPDELKADHIFHKLRLVAIVLLVDLTSHNSLAKAYEFVLHLADSRGVIAQKRDVILSFVVGTKQDLHHQRVVSEDQLHSLAYHMSKITPSDSTGQGTTSHFSISTDSGFNVDTFLKSFSIELLWQCRAQSRFTSSMQQVLPRVVGNFETPSASAERDTAATDRAEKIREKSDLLLDEIDARAPSPSYSSPRSTKNMNGSIEFSPGGVRKTASGLDVPWFKAKIAADVPVARPRSSLSTRSGAFSHRSGISGRSAGASTRRGYLWSQGSRSKLNNAPSGSATSRNTPTSGGYNRQNRDVDRFGFDFRPSPRPSTSGFSSDHKKSMPAFVPACAQPRNIDQQRLDAAIRRREVIASNKEEYRFRSTLFHEKELESKHEPFNFEAKGNSPREEDENHQTPFSFDAGIMSDFKSDLLESASVILDQQNMNLSQKSIQQDKDEFQERLREAIYGFCQDKGLREEDAASLFDRLEHSDAVVPRLTGRYAPRVALSTEASPCKAPPSTKLTLPMNRAEFPIKKTLATSSRSSPAEQEDARGSSQMRPQLQQQVPYVPIQQAQHIWQVGHRMQQQVQLQQPAVKIVMQDPAIVSRTQFGPPLNVNLIHVVPGTHVVNPSSGQPQPGRRPIYPWSNVSSCTRPQAAPITARSTRQRSTPSANTSPAPRMFPGPVVQAAFVPLLPLPAHGRIASTSQLSTASPPNASPSSDVRLPDPRPSAPRPSIGVSMAGGDLLGQVSGRLVPVASQEGESCKSVKDFRESKTQASVKQEDRIDRQEAAPVKVRTSSETDASVTKLKVVSTVVHTQKFEGRLTSAEYSSSKTNLTRDNPVWNNYHQHQVDRKPKVEPLHGRMEKSHISKRKRRKRDSSRPANRSPSRPQTLAQRKLSLEFNDNAYVLKKEKSKLPDTEKLQPPEGGADMVFGATTSATEVLATKENTAPDISKVDVIPLIDIELNEQNKIAEGESAVEDAQAQSRAQQVLKEVLDEVQALPATVSASATPSWEGVLDSYSASPALAKNLNASFAQVEGLPQTPLHQISVEPLQEWPPEQHDPREDSCARPQPPPAHPFNDLAPAPKVQQWVERKKIALQQQSNFLRKMSDRSLNATKLNIADSSPASAALIDCSQLAPVAIRGTTYEALETSGILNGSFDVTQPDEDALDRASPNFTTETTTAANQRNMITWTDGVSHQAVEDGEPDVAGATDAESQHKQTSTLNKVENVFQRIVSPIKSAREGSTAPEDQIEIHGAQQVPPPPPSRLAKPRARRAVLPLPLRQQVEQQQSKPDAPLILQEMPLLSEVSKGDVDGQVLVPLPIQHKQESSSSAPIQNSMIHPSTDQQNSNQQCTVQVDASPKAHELEVQDKGSQEDENLLTVVQQHPLLGRLVFTADMDLGPQVGVGEIKNDSAEKGLLRVLITAVAAGV